MSEWAFGVRISSEDVEAERGIVMEEWRKVTKQSHSTNKTRKKHKTQKHKREKILKEDFLNLIRRSF